MEGMVQAQLEYATASGLPLIGLSSQASVFSLLKEWSKSSDIIDLGRLSEMIYVKGLLCVNSTGHIVSA